MSLRPFDSAQAKPGPGQADIKALQWLGDRLKILDQTRLPREEIYLECFEPEQVAAAIREMKVRGAPIIGLAAAFGMALGAMVSGARTASQMQEDVARCAELLASTRPTARNLFYALERMKTASARGYRSVIELRSALIIEALAFEQDEIRACTAMAEKGAELVPEGARVLTYCNTGSLAAPGPGTALGVIRKAHSQGKRVQVIVPETRPLLQGARLTAWELEKEGIPYTLIADGAAGWLMRSGEIDLVLVGADRIAANGDAANKVGTYTMAALAARHGLPFYVAAPTSTIDLSLPDGSAIPIEERDQDEVRSFAGVQSAPQTAAARNPAFDVTPADLISAIITEKGIARPPFEKAWRDLGIM
jgi:methylthioribose-1-phosphate isomerase